MEIIEQPASAASWPHVPDAEALPPAGAVTVTLARWREDGALIARRGAPTGVRLAPEDQVETLASGLATVGMVAIEFPKFTEGRGYTQARLLRERYGYRGPLRAVGDVSRDRVAFMRRCGFDSCELRPGEEAAAAAAAIDEISVAFQPAVDGAEFAARRRRWRT